MFKAAHILHQKRSDKLESLREEALSLFDFGKYDLQNGVRAEFDFLTALKP
jgi:hypothetical protein